MFSPLFAKIILSYIVFQRSWPIWIAQLTRANQIFCSQMSFLQLTLPPNLNVCWSFTDIHVQVRVVKWSNNAHLLYVIARQHLHSDEPPLNDEFIKGMYLSNIKMTIQCPLVHAAGAIIYRSFQVWIYKDSRWDTAKPGSLVPMKPTNPHQIFTKIITSFGNVESRNPTLHILSIMVISIQKSL